jgi:phosphoenolpyruvate carboxylase
VQQLARHVPARRKRKLHIGLFGYARSMGAVRLPRAISFTAALYSIGLPPELLGLEALREGDLGLLRETYLNLDDDLADAARYLNPDTGFVPAPVLDAVRALGLDAVEQDDEHVAVTSEIARRVRAGEHADLSDLVLRAARLRRFLG